MRDYEELVKRLREAPSDWPDAELHYDAADAIEDLIAALTASNEVIAKSGDKWISVEDELPKKGTVVLAFGTRSATTGMFQGVGTAPWFWWWKGHTIKRVTHWMPLPSMEGLNET